jgi:hypothetical protein
MVEPDLSRLLRDRLESAAAGLVYSSEGDHPFRFVELGAATDRWPPVAGDFAAMVDAGVGEQIEEMSLHEFLARHVERVDPMDTEAQALRPRYDELRRTLRTELRDLRVFRVGQVRVRCFALGLDPATGRVCGLETLAIET